MKGPVTVRIDAWIGRTLFVPLIIAFCRRFGTSQHRFSRTCWFAAALIGLWAADHWIESVLFGLMALAFCISSALLSDTHEERSWRWLRLMVAGATVLCIPMWALDGLTWHLPYNLLVLFAEYAATIRTIPPLEAKAPEPKRQAQEQGA